MVNSVSFSDRFKELLKMKNITKAELSRLTGISKSSLTHYERGDFEGKQENVSRIAKATNVSESWLMGLTDNPSRTTIITKLPVGDKIHMVRRIKRMTLQDLANASEMPVGRINAYELRRDNPSLEDLNRIAAALSVPVSVLASETEIWRLSHPEQKEKLRSAAEAQSSIDEGECFQNEFEDQLLSICEVFNEDGQAAVLDRVAEMTEIQRYRKHRFDEPDF